jgi:multisubunit Na+/H+ antiporter MnhE subunit
VSGGKQGKHPPVTGRRGRRWSRVWPWLAAWALLFTLWMLLAGTLALSEILAGSAAAAVAATAVEVVRRQGLVRFRPDPRWLLRAWGLPWKTIREFVALMVALGRSLTGGRRVRGRFVALPFRAGGNDPRSSARRAVFALGASFAPNTYVVDFDRTDGEVLVHQLLPPYAKQSEDVLP